jgi:hypothetical protein
MGVMKIRCFSFAVFMSAALSARTVAGADHENRRATLISGLGEVHHAVSTKSREAQQFFDQGLKLVYGFNHDEARRSFLRAAELDPKLAMAWWGVALTLGPNYNLPVDPEREKQGYEAAQRAVALEDFASEPERGYIHAVAVRYSDDPHVDLHQLDRTYKEAMGNLTSRYPDDLDAATLYAESAMNLRPWQLWTADGKPAEGTEEIISVLESVLRRDLNHLGANHYYIHAVEASPHPERGLASADRLQKLAPAAGHLVHMPAHIYARVGDHIAAANCNMRAAAADRQFLQSTHEQGVYPLMYYSHNLHFLAYSSCMDGSFAEAADAASKLVANVAPHVKEMPMLEGFLPTPFVVSLAFGRWDDILKAPAPDPSLQLTNAVWHFVRGMAFAHNGKTEQAVAEQTAFREITKKIPADADYDPLNKAAAVFKIHENLLAGAIARSRHETEPAINALYLAVAAEDALNYSEPPTWYPPLRPTLGQILLAENRSADAEKIAREDLDRNPRDARALALLRDSLQAQNRAYDAAQVNEQFRSAWKSNVAKTP